MKKYLPFIFSLYLNINLFAQDYTPTLTLNKVWNMHHYDGFIPDNNYDFNITLDYMETVNGTEYFHASNGDLLREDIANKKIYRLVNDVEELLLDFDLQIGDALISPIVADSNSNANIITEINTDTFYNIPDLKYYSLDCGEKIIEGIGLLSVGLFGLSSGCEPVDYTEGNLLVSMSTLSINNYFIENNITIFYNRESKNLKINNAKTPIHIQIFSTLGKKVIEIDTDRFIDISFLEKGVYFYVLFKNNSVKKGKVLIY